MNSAPPQLRNQAPRRRRTPPARRKAVSRRKKQTNWRRLSILAALGVGAVSLGWAMLARALAPTGTTAASHFDAVIVLGSRVDSDGNPTPLMLSRVSEGVREYARGVAPQLILTGGRQGKFIQANAMARIAEAQGVPESKILIEPNADDTMENACFSARILKAHGWRSAEIVTSATHVPRAAMIFSKLPIDWRMHAAPPLEPPPTGLVTYANTLETLKTVRYLLYAQWADRCTP